MSMFVSEPAAEKVRRHPKYYLLGGDMFFLVENYLFRVHRYFFDRESAWFRERLGAPAPAGQTAKGSSDANPFPLEDILANDFARFLWVFYNPKYSIYDATIEDWTAILKLAFDWRFNEVKKLCTRELEKFNIDPVQKIQLYQTYDLDKKLLIPSYSALCARLLPLNIKEGRQLGIETALNIASAREAARKTTSKDGARSPPPAVEGEELVSIIKEMFGITAGPPSPSLTPIDNNSSLLERVGTSPTRSSVPISASASASRPLSPMHQRTSSYSTTGLLQNGSSGNRGTGGDSNSLGITTSFITGQVEERRDRLQRGPPRKPTALQIPAAAIPAEMEMEMTPAAGPLIPSVTETTMTTSTPGGKVSKKGTRNGTPRKGKTTSRTGIQGRGKNESQSVHDSFDGGDDYTTIESTDVVDPETNSVEAEGPVAKIDNTVVTASERANVSPIEQSGTDSTSSKESGGSDKSSNKTSNQSIKRPAPNSDTAFSEQSELSAAAAPGIDVDGNGKTGEDTQGHGDVQDKEVNPSVCNGYPQTTSTTDQQIESKSDSVDKIESTDTTHAKADENEEGASPPGPSQSPAAADAGNTGLTASDTPTVPEVTATTETEKPEDGSTSKPGDSALPPASGAEASTTASEQSDSDTTIVETLVDI